MKVRVVSDEGEFRAMRQAWDALLGRSGTGSVFLTWEWLYTWWKSFGDDKQLYIIVAGDDETRAILPLYRRKVPGFVYPGSVKLEFLGTGEERSDEVCSYMLDMIAEAGCEEQAYADIFAFLREVRPCDWDLMSLKFVSSRSGFIDAARRYFGEDAYTVHVEESFRNGITLLDDGWQGFYNGLGKKTRKMVRSGRRRLESMNGFSYRFLQRRDELSGMLDAFVKLSLKRWGGGGAFASPKFSSFQRAVCEEFADRGMLKLSLMEVGGRPVAGNLDYCYRDTVYGYQTAFDAGFSKNLSVGLLGMLYCIENAAEEGFRKYDWYRVARESYKERFISCYEEIVNLVVARKSFYIALLGLLGRLKKL
ncbi:MAG TPA: GNAT family N-acetyltransferase [Deltaproteobacteria bacterium]|nr:GNAT family N-acetyltransferase [Deltaproteobacteria bacterium]